MKLTLPFPPASLSPNRARSLHWAQKARIAAQYREECGWAAKAVWGDRPPLTTPVTLAVTFVVADGRRHDKDNLISAFKSGLDGLVDAGVLLDDDYRLVDVNYANVKRGPERYVEVEVLT
jgi:Holliday junction resolvase RusA-like endonuclease